MFGEAIEGLARAVGRTNWLYAQYVNRLHGRSGHLWQNRFYSCGLDEPHLWTALRYVERNPLRAGLCRRAQDYRWSSAAAHVAGQDDVLVRAAPLLALEPRWARHLAADPDAETVRQLRRHEATGRPAGSERFLKRLERLLDRVLRPRKPGRPRKCDEK